MLEFEEESHTYTLEGAVLPSVTGILEPLVDLSSIPEFRLEIARERGTNVHKATELHDMGTLDNQALDPELIGYIEAWKDFIKDTGFEVEFLEQRVYHPKYLYAGTIDRVGKLNGKRGILDIKATYSIMEVVEPQTAAYLEAWNAMNGKEEKAETRHAIQLKPDGTYKLHPCKCRGDFTTFTSCLNIYRWRQNHV